MFSSIEFSGKRRHIFYLSYTKSMKPFIAFLHGAANYVLLSILVTLNFLIRGGIVFVLCQIGGKRKNCHVTSQKQKKKQIEKG